MANPSYDEYVEELYNRLQKLQNHYIAEQNPNAQMIGPLLALTMLVKSDLLPFARDRYKSMEMGPQWKIAEDHLLELRNDVESMLAGPNAFYNRKAG